MKNMLSMMLLLIVTGCRFGNLQIYEKNNIDFFGRNYLGWGDGVYNILNIGNPRLPFYECPPRFCIILHNGQVLKSTEFSLENIKNIDGIKVVHNVPDTTNPPFWAEKATICTFLYDSKKAGVAGYGFRFTDGKLMAFSIWSSYWQDEYAVYIGPYSGDKFYRLPMSLKEVESIFGKADVIKARFYLPPEPTWWKTIR